LPVFRKLPHSLASPQARLEIRLDEDQRRARKNQMSRLGRLFLMLQRMDRNVADIAVMAAIAPGPVTCNVEHVKILTVQQFGNRFMILAALLANHRLRRGTAHRHWRGIMRCKHFAGERNIRQVAAMRRDPGVKIPFRTVQHEFRVRACICSFHVHA
jgi:hypothetical protein